ncbi:hypothetical protein [Flavobacterium aquiphilum]|uniref:hypothetical protein n=1 Tax=Flavobacterium aquiphilum TaxID=3003261 RepID=UPI002480BE07|nr:hypothetical protein [Flavobacterium aquiphilum]
MKLAENPNRADLLRKFAIALVQYVPTKTSHKANFSLQKMTLNINYSNPKLNG